MMHLCVCSRRRAVTDSHEFPHPDFLLRPWAYDCVLRMCQDELASEVNTLAG